MRIQQFPHDATAQLRSLEEFSEEVRDLVEQGYLEVDSHNQTGDLRLNLTARGREEARRAVRKQHLDPETHDAPVEQNSGDRLTLISGGGASC